MAAARGAAGVVRASLGIAVLSGAALAAPTVSDWIIDAVALTAEAVERAVQELMSGLRLPRSWPIA